MAGMAAFSPLVYVRREKGRFLIPNQENTGEPSDNLQKLCHDESNLSCLTLLSALWELLGRSRQVSFG